MSPQSPSLRRLGAPLLVLLGAALTSAPALAAQSKPNTPVAFEGRVSGVALSSGSSQTWEGKVKFVRARKNLYVTRSGAVTWSYSSTTARGCTGQLGPTTFAIGREQAAILFLGKPKGKRAGKTYVINPEISYLGSESEIVTHHCPDGDTVDIRAYRAPWIGTDGYVSTPRSGAVGGTFTDPGEGSFAANPLRWEYDLRPIFRKRR